MKILELERVLEARIGAVPYFDWDNDGRMLLPDPEREVKRVLVALDATAAVMDRAIAIGADLILTHHPLIFQPLRRIDDLRLLRLVKEGIAVYSYHTRLDAVQGGVNDCLAEALGLLDPYPFGEDGMGRVGDLPEETSVCVFAERIKDCLGSPSITVLDSGNTILRVAVLGGAGKDHISAAAESGADAFVTGEAGYNALLDAEGGEMSIFCAGHYHTEQPVCKRLAAWVSEAVPGSEVEVYAGCELKVL